MYISVFSHGNLPHRFTVEVGMFTKLANDENPNVRDFFDSTYWAPQRPLSNGVEGPDSWKPKITSQYCWVSWLDNYF